MAHQTHSGSFSFGGNLNQLNPIPGNIPNQQFNTAQNLGLLHGPSFANAQTLNNQNQNLVNTNPNTQTKNIFGANNPQTPQITQQLFGQTTLPQLQTPSLNTSGNLFGQQKTQETTGLFGGPGISSTQKPVFGQITPVAQSTSGNLFGNTTQATPNLGASLFGTQQPAISHPVNQNIFGTQPNQGVLGFNNNQALQQVQIIQGTVENQGYFQPNAVFAFNNFAQQTNKALNTLDNYKLIQNKEKQEKLAQFNFLFQVNQNTKLELSELNKLSQIKISELDEKYSRVIKNLDEQIRNNCEKLKKMKESVLEIENNPENRISEQIRNSAMKAKELNFKIEQLLQTFEFCNRDFKDYQTIVADFKTQMPVYAYHYIQKTQFPSKALQTLSKSLSDKLRVINSTVSELICFLEAPSNLEERGKNDLANYVDIVDELFYCVKFLSAQNRSVQNDLKSLKGGSFGNLKESDPRTAMVMEQEDNLSGNALDIGMQLNKIIAQAK